MQKEAVSLSLSLALFFFSLSLNAFSKDDHSRIHLTCFLAPECIHSKRKELIFFRCFGRPLPSFYRDCQRRQTAEACEGDQRHTRLSVSLSVSVSRTQSR